jgi:hypothetical protein
MGQVRNSYKILVGKPEVKDHLKVLGIDGKITLKWILGKRDGKVWTGCIWLRIGSSGGTL